MANPISDQIILKLSSAAGTTDTAGTDWISNLKSDYDKNINKVLNSVSDSYGSGAQSIVTRLPNMTSDIDKNDQAGSLIKSLKSGYGGLDTFRFEAHRAMVKDIDSVVSQFPGLDTAVGIICNAVTESDEAAGTLQLKPTIPTINNMSTSSMIDNIDSLYKVKHKMRDVTIPNTVKFGNSYCYMVPYSKILSFIARVKSKSDNPVTLSESVISAHMIVEKGKNNKQSYVKDQQLKNLFESATAILKETDVNKDKDAAVIINTATETILNNITIAGDYAATMVEEYGPDGLTEYIKMCDGAATPPNMFEEYDAKYDKLNIVSDMSDDYQKDPNKSFDYSEFKGVYIKWIDSTMIVPCRIGDKVLGYFFVDRNANPLSPRNTGQNARPMYNGARLDLSAMTTLSQNRPFVNDIANMLIDEIDKPFLKQNIKFIDDIVDIIMEQDFTSHSIKMTFIPVEDIVPFRINEDSEGYGRSAIAKSLPRARLYTLIMMAEALTILNNRPTRVYKVRRDPFNNDFNATMQGMKMWLHSRLISPDDTINYGSGLSKLGANTDILLPLNQAGEAPFTKDFEQGYEGQVHNDFLDELKKDALNATHVPSVMTDNASAVEFAKSLELANTEFVSFIKKTKAELSVYISDFLRKLISYTYGIPEVNLKNFAVTLPEPRQQDLVITNEMINNFTALRDMLFAIYYRDDDIKEDGKLNSTGRRFAKAIAKQCMPQIPYDEYDKIVNETKAEVVGDEMEDQLRQADLLKSTEQDISDEDLEK